MHSSAERIPFRISDKARGDTERGQTVYRLADDGRLHVSDSVLRDGAMHPFASHILIRSD